MKLSAEQKERYSKHIMLERILEKGQQRLLESRVLCIGAGGLGSPVIAYLAAAGVGVIGIMDDDVVELSNLQRQVIHGGNLGRPKAESAAQFVHCLNEDVGVVVYQVRLTADNVMELVGKYDVVIDCSDNFATRYLVNDACVLAGRPLFHGSIYMFEGQVMTILPGQGPCYRCLFARPPNVDAARMEGVMGVLPGVVGSIQATEVVKYLTGTGELLVGRMLYYDALSMSFDEIKVTQNPKCPVCGPDPVIKFIDADNYG